MNDKAKQIAILSITTPSVIDIAAAMNTTKLSVLGAYASLKKEGLAVYENGNIILTEAGKKEFAPVDEVLNEIASLMNDLDIEVVSIKVGSRKATCHEVYTANPTASKSELNKLLQQATGLARRPCYVIQYNYERAVGIK